MVDGVRPWIVLKFGGTSVATATGWAVIAGAIERTLQEGARPLVVCSALAGISNQLSALLDAAANGEDPEPRLEKIRATHLQLAAALDIDATEILAEELDELRRLAMGVAMLQEATPRARAAVMSKGELMSTRLGAAWLQRMGLPVAWKDARNMLEADDDVESPLELRYLSAVCDAEPDPELQARLDEEAVVTQGFVARGPDGDTVLLGRGGSDTSAAYFGAKLSAKRVEIWTDVPGMFSTNPNDEPEARLLSRLGYDEAESLAALGARVLHPRCIAPLRTAGTPLHVRCTYAPDLAGTVVGPHETDAGIKAVSVRRGLCLVWMDRPPEWQPVGYLAEVSACFARHGLSIDLLATSRSRITATIDLTAAPHAEHSVDALIDDLRKVCRAGIRRGVSSVSLVGSGLRSTLDRLGPALSGLSGERIRMVSQGADDAHLTLVVDDGDASALAAELHQSLFAEEAPSEAFGPRWSELDHGRPEPTAKPAPVRQAPAAK